ncbi:bacterial regulatory s, tetR family protein [Sphingomonas sp. S17]|jgi:AcrR family transcriptional regulator|uniref:TetR/AcrR family transcriptional regulator n=2 Tax=Sphingomonas paucimobilis TaxID=13689 RepID=A0A7Y2PDQ5_SPHPI|nr:MULTISPECIES: TetR/AcrR family transcriptional regulator [Sphingomonas]EGI54535.1 bacterial regulatory s, tetR family protein [Sphingomonas sp. S17]MCM3680902.1 TetR/AcrR family transcriptional regulator [Sphingomonas paucimobilis]MDG5971387.1 TetR/AcrR family transcriptional regulator [Sphingomonas paucimobilis]NNG58735.1 TetR/AcrR family transcriptional regulator [Sphingomonas paucimobilis]QPS15954.1 TetR/AcrR family transcriptional regulator [Sphingomonas paucimobilis]
MVLPLRDGGPAMPVAGRGRPSLERAAEIGHLVVEAAIAAFVEQGLDISIEQIAQSVGVSKQAVYRRWSSKIRLLMDVMDRVMAKIHAKLSQDLPDDALLALKELSRRMCEPDGGVRERTMTILMAEALEDTAVRHWLGSWRDQHFAFYRRYVTAVLPMERSERSDETIARILLDIVEGVSREAYWQDLSDAECATLFSRKWGASLPLLNE